jgi:sedoheptulokinase
MYLGIDIGTSKTAAVIVDAARHTLAAESIAHRADRPTPPGHAEQDAQVLLDSAWQAVERLPRELREQVQAIGVTGQMHGVVLLDERAQAVGPLITWQDQRGREIVARLQQQTTSAIHEGYGTVTLAWLAVHGQITSVCRSACTIQDLAVVQLCGLAKPVTDPTDAASWGFFDLQNSDWERKALTAAGVPEHLLPTVQPSGSKAGTLHEIWARRFGLKPRVPVAVAMGDNQASLLATLREPEQEIVLTLGTGGQVSAILSHTATPPPAQRTFECRPYPDNRVVVVGAALCGGAAWLWLAQNLERWLDELGYQPPDRAVIFTKLNELGLAATNEDAVAVRPHFLGERYDRSLSGTIGGLGLNGPTLGALARGTARGIMENLKNMLPIEALAGRVRLVGSGNALRHNSLLRHMAEGVFALPLVMSETAEEAAVGAAWNAANVVQNRILRGGRCDSPK